MAINLNNALTRFNSEGIDIEADFHTLRSSQVEVVWACAQADGYRKSKNANGSTARCYFEALQRQHQAAKRG